VRATIRKAIPKAEEKISYGLATFTLNDSYVVYMSGAKKHLALHPWPRGGNDALQKDIEPYKHGKGTLQFPLNKPMPLELITRIARQLEKDNEERTSKSKE
jgi:uncharacterized protein YdhG (YjbR/CyaY superfamily)